MKRFLSIFLVAMMGLSLVACGSDSAPQNEENSVSQTFYDKNDLGSILSAVTAEGETAIQTISEDSTSLLDKLGETYDSYDANKASVDDFYSSSLDESKKLYATFETMSMDYFKCVSAQGLEDYDTWDGAMEDFYDTWDETMEDYYDAWDEAYEDIYDKCDDLIESASDTIDYDVYSDAWSEMYDGYSDSWSNMYEAYSDAWSKTYNDYSDVWSGFYNDETDVESILNAVDEKDAQTENSNESTSNSSTENSSTETDTSTQSAQTSELVDGMRPEFKEAMDSYETFIDEYIAFMEKYAASDGSDLSLLTDYTSYMSKYADMMADFEQWENEEMNTEETAYYIEVQSRVSQKLLQVAQ